MAITNNFSETILELVTDITSAETALYSEAIFEAAFEIGNVADNHTVLTGVRNGNVIPIISTNPAYNSFPFKNPNDCNIPACDLDLDFAAKAWQLGMIACKIPICINTFDDNFLAFWRSYKRVFGDEDLDSALMRFIIDKFQANLQAAMWRVIWFGDTTTDVGDPNYALLRAVDGIFTQAEAGGGIKVEITQNATNDLTGEQVYAYLTDAYTQASILPWWDSTVRIEMTQAMAAVYVAWLNSLGDKSPYQCECYAADGITAMRNYSVDANLRFAGIPIHVHREFDGVINALTLGRPYRALITSSNNIIIGTSELDQLPAFDIWYSKDDDMIYIKGGAQLGASLVTNDYIYLGAENSGS
jgi:hypothetical protein